MKKINSRSILTVAAAAICVAFVYNLAVNFFEGRALDKVISGELSSAKISAKDLVGKIRHAYTEKRYWVADSFSFEDFEKRLQRSLEKSGFKLQSIFRSTKESIIKGKKENRQEVSYVISDPSSNVPVFRLTLIRRISLPVPTTAPKAPVIPSPVTEKPVTMRPKMAIVLDDWGYNTNNLDSILQVDKPITFSILPDLPHSTFIAKEAREKSFEVILHMPMEPKAKMRLESDTLYTSMSDDEIRSGLNKSLYSVPYAVGISNHEGSKATEDMRLMGVVLEELKKRNMFFLDSFVTNDSTVEYLAEKIGVKFAKRSIFLDNKSDPEYIKGQFEKAMDFAVKTGEVIAIGHDRPNTITVLKKMIPEIESRGIDITSVSNLVR